MCGGKRGFGRRCFPSPCMLSRMLVRKRLQWLLGRFVVLLFGVVGVGFALDVSAAQYNREAWSIRMPEYRIGVSSLFTSADIPSMRDAEAAARIPERTLTRFEHFALLAQLGHESFRGLYNSGYVWVAIRLEGVRGRGVYDGRLVDLTVLLEDGSRVWAAVFHTHKLNPYSIASGSSLIFLEEGVAFRDFSTQTLSGSQYQVFVGFPRIFDVSEVVAVEWAGVDSEKK